MPPARWALLLLGVPVLWVGGLSWLYDGDPTPFAFVRLLLPVVALSVAGWAALAIRRPRDLSWALLLAAFLGMAALTAWGVQALRKGQAVPAEALRRITLDRRADETGKRPRSNFVFRAFKDRPMRSVELSGQVANDTDLPLWEVTLKISFSYRGEVVWEEPVVFRTDIPPGGLGKIAWYRVFSLEELPPEPAWEVTVLSARKHW